MPSIRMKTPPLLAPSSTTTCSPPKGTGRSSAAASARTITTSCSGASARRSYPKTRTAGTWTSASTARSYTPGSGSAWSAPWRGSAASRTSARQSRSRVRCTGSGREETVCVIVWQFQRACGAQDDRPARSARSKGMTLQGLSLHLVPQPVQLFQACPSDVHAALRREPLHCLEPPPELVVRPLERRAGINAQLARQVHDGEQEITDLIPQRMPHPAARIPHLDFELHDLFFHLVERSRRIGPIEPHARRPFLQPIRHQERRQGGRQSTEGPAPSSLLLALHPFPALVIRCR